VKKTSRTNLRPINEKTHPKNKPVNHLHMYILLCLILAFGAVTSALVIERQTHLDWDNRTIACGRAFIGGCCDGDQDSTYGYSPNCYNATKVATDVGGSTFGPRDEFECANHLTGNKTQHLFQPICCKMMTLMTDSATRATWTFMSCLTQPGNPVK